jgi:hypothetical protein
LNAFRPIERELDKASINEISHCLLKMNNIKLKILALSRGDAASSACGE